jgi:hypothetical protein
VRREGLGKLEKFILLIGSGTRDLPACGIVDQPTELPRAPCIIIIIITILMIMGVCLEDVWGVRVWLQHSSSVFWNAV